MQAIQGYFDGTVIRPLGEIIAKPNQRVIIAITDEFVDPPKAHRKKSLRGILAQYANYKLAKEEKGAWERAAVEKHGIV